MSKNSTLNELKIAQQELLFHHRELEKCAHDLKVANENLGTGAVEKEKRAGEVHQDLEEMMFTVSHRVRKSVATILGISNLLEADSDMGVPEWREMLHIIIQSAESLNVSTEELSKFIHLKKNNCSGNT